MEFIHCSNNTEGNNGNIFCFSILSIPNIKYVSEIRFFNSELPVFIKTTYRLEKKRENLTFPAI